MTVNLTDTIAAVATPLGEGGIGVIRVSGGRAIEAAAAVFAPVNGSLCDLPDRLLTRGAVRDEQAQLLDDAMAAVMRAGHSYTGEDVVELHCHGAPALLQAVLELLFAQGVRLAGAGEFTRRAFLNGRLDLTQAEAVADLITAPDGAAVRNAAGQLEGLLKRQIGKLWDSITHLCARFYVCLDYAGDGVEDLDAEALTAAMADIAGELKALAATGERGKRLREGIAVAIVGKPNVGKSSLLNALLGYDRAIVTPRAGTTRDTLSELMPLGGKLFRFTDTAGLRDSGDEIEAMGVERARRAAQSADIILLVLDGSKPLDDEDKAVLALAGGNSVLVINKKDLRQALSPSRFAWLPQVCAVSALTGDGIGGLADAILRCAGDDPPRDGTILTNARQTDAVNRAAQAVESAARALDIATPDVVVSELEMALDALSQLTGKHVSQSIVDDIFARFCVGK